MVLVLSLDLHSVVLVLSLDLHPVVLSLDLVVLAGAAPVPMHQQDRLRPGGGASAEALCGWQDGSELCPAGTRCGLTDIYLCHCFTAKSHDRPTFFFPALGSISMKFLKL